MNSVIMDKTDNLGNRTLDNEAEVGDEARITSKTSEYDGSIQTENPGANNEEADSAFKTFAACQPLLFGIAYRMLGQISDAEDMIHEVWLRWRNQDAGRVRSAKAWLGCTMRRLCIDQLRSARRQREHGYGLVAPEPAMTHDGSDDHQEQNSSLAAAFAILLRTLRPTERAVFMLREVFGYEYSETAALVGKSDENCRQIACRAKTQLGRSAQVQPEPDLCAHQLAEAFLSAVATGQLSNFLELLTDSASNDGSFANARQSCRRRSGTTSPLWPIRIAFPIHHSRRPICSFATTPPWTEVLHGRNPLERYRGQPGQEDIS